MKKLTIAATQYGLTDIHSEEQFWTGIMAKVRDAAEQGAEMIVFPEYMTAHLLSLEHTMLHDEACRHLDKYTDQYVQFFLQLSREWNIAILAGSHICKIDNNEFANKAFLFFPDGRIESQIKLHLTPEEQIRWPLAAGNELNVFDTEWGKMAILTCYDIEFPELARVAALRGAELLLCPSYTDSVFGYYRVRHCCQSRAIENQVFVALSGLVGALSEDRPQVDQGHCQAGVFTPCDLPFTENGIVQVGELNLDMTVLAEVDFRKLRENRERGAVAPFYDRRPELYEQELRKTLL
jgi:predicted amidohydrolase